MCGICIVSGVHGVCVESVLCMMYMVCVCGVCIVPDVHGCVVYILCLTYMVSMGYMVCEVCLRPHGRAGIRQCGRVGEGF